MDREVARSRARIARRLAAHLKASGISFVVVGDSRAYNVEVLSDIDIVVRDEDLAAIPGVLREFCSVEDGKLVQAIQHEETAWYFVLVFGSGGNRTYIHPDVSSDYRQRGRKLLSAEEFFEDSTVHESFPRPAPRVAFIYYLLKKVYKGRINHRQFEYLVEQWHKEPDGARTKCARFWNAQDVEIVSQAICEKDLTLLRNVLGRLRRRSTCSTWERVWGGWREMSRYATRFRQPTGVWISLRGTSGTSTLEVGEVLARQLAPAFRRTALLSFTREVEVEEEASDGLSEGRQTTERSTHNRSTFVAAPCSLAAALLLPYVLVALVRSTLVVSGRAPEGTPSADSQLTLPQTRHRGVLRPDVDVVVGPSGVQGGTSARVLRVAFERDSALMEAASSADALVANADIDTSWHDEAAESITRIALKFMEHRLMTRLGGRG